MTLTQNDIDRLRKAIVNGTQRVRFEDGREIVYRSIAELRQALDMAERDLGVKKRRSHSVIAF